jgi:hypothetical protein
MHNNVPMPDIRQQLADMLSDGIYEITLLEPDDLTADEHAPIPAWWFEALAQPNPTAALNRALDQWDTLLPGRLPKFLTYAREHGQGLFLGRQDLDLAGTQVVLIYALTDSTGRKPFHCWVGSPPAPDTAIPHQLQQLPAQVKAFHTHLHDAFRWAVKVYLGILPLTELDPVSDYIGPGDLQLVNTDTEPDYTRIIAIYSYSTPKICAELSDDPDSTAGWYWPGGEIEPIDDFWQDLDDWLTLNSTG